MIESGTTCSISARPRTLTVTAQNMWQSCSAHIRDKTGVSVLRLKCPPGLPSGNSTLKVWRAELDLHRLASFNVRGRVRFYSSHALTEPGDNEPRLWAPRELGLSDTQRRTIYALSTPPGKAGVAVVRISGPDALDVRRKMVKPYSAANTHPDPWKMERCRI